MVDQGLKADFVGPYNGTQPPDEALPPLPPKFAGETDALGTPRVTGGYAPSAESFDSAHFAVWGRQVHGDKDVIFAYVWKY